MFKVVQQRGKFFADGWKHFKIKTSPKMLLQKFYAKIIFFADKKLRIFIFKEIQI